MTPEQIAAQINARGSTGDEALAVMAKGLVDGMNAVKEMGLTLAAMVQLNKGKGGDNDEPAEGSEGGDGAGGDGDEGGDAPGYEDMQLSVQPPAGVDNVLDVTAFVFKTAAAIESLTKSVKATRAENAELKQMLAKSLKAQETLGELLVKSTQATIDLVAPLAKGISDTHESLMQIPAAGITPARFPGRAPAPADVVLIGGTKRSEAQALAKGLRTGVIDPAAKVLFEKTRKFAADEAQHQAIRTQLDTIGAEFAPAT